MNIRSNHNITSPKGLKVTNAPEKTNEKSGKVKTSFFKQVTIHLAKAKNYISGTNKNDAHYSKKKYQNTSAEKKISSRLISKKKGKTKPKVKYELGKSLSNNQQRTKNNTNTQSTAEYNKDPKKPSVTFGETTVIGENNKHQNVSAKNNTNTQSAAEDLKKYSVTFEDNVTVYKQKMETRADYKYNDALIESRKNPGLSDIISKGGDDMDIYDFIQNRFNEKNDTASMNLLNDCNSNEALNILRDSGHFNSSEMRMLKQSNTDLEGSPYW